jgi:uncharacterized protein (UPF0276 family)
MSRSVISTPDQGARAEGVGIAYHPFLHDAFLKQSDAFDFVELPLDLYIDPAQSALLDPEDTRLKEIIDAKPCVWRGTALSMGSVEFASDLAYPPAVIRRIRERLEQAAATHYTDVIGFRRLDGHDLGLVQAMPRTQAAARWIAARQLAASEAIGRPVLLQLPSNANSPPLGGLDDATFLHRIVAVAGACLVLDTADLAKMATKADASPRDAAMRLPRQSVAVVSCSAADETDWAMLAVLTAQTDVRSIVLRRDRNLFPIDTIASDAERAAGLLMQVCDRPFVAPQFGYPTEETDPWEPDPGEFAELHAYQAACVRYVTEHAMESVPPELAHIPDAIRQTWATDVRSWQNWRGQVDDTHKTQQIAAFLARSAANRVPRRA